MQAFLLVGFVNCISFIDFSDGRNFIKGFKRRRINHSVLIFIFKEESLVHQEYAENIRRSLMLWDGMGTEPSHLELLKLRLIWASLTTVNRFLAVVLRF